MGPRGMSGETVKETSDNRRGMSDFGGFGKTGSLYVGRYMSRRSISDGKDKKSAMKKGAMGKESIHAKRER